MFGSVDAHLLRCWIFNTKIVNSENYGVKSRRWKYKKIWPAIALGGGKLVKNKNIGGTNKNDYLKVWPSIKQKELGKQKTQSCGALGHP